MTYTISMLFAVVLNYEEDIGVYTIKVANDPTACNRIVIFRPPENIISQLELVSLWEKKTGRSFKRVHVSEEELVKLSESKTFKFLINCYANTSLYVGVSGGGNIKNLF